MTEPEHIKIEGLQQLELDVDDVRIIVATLRKQPYELVANTLDKIKAQLLNNQCKMSYARAHAMNGGQEDAKPSGMGL